jgi:hypothetical protein
MHSTAINLQQAADILEVLEVEARNSSGTILAIIGTHPALGSTVLVQGLDDVRLVSEFALEN